jgi:hypothetical protein
MVASTMDEAAAREISHRTHAGQRNRFGELVIEHVQRVAAAVAAPDRVTAFLHDVLERTAIAAEDLIERGLAPIDLAALELLTRDAGESFEAHALRIAHAEGPAGELARRVKVADLEDHLRHPSMPPGAPPYAWARQHMRAVQARRGELPRLGLHTTNA